MKHETQSVPDGGAPVDSDQRCEWSTDFDPDEPNAQIERCTTGKPALFFSCNVHGPVCEDHICRCRPSLLTERAEKRRRAEIERCLTGLAKIGVPETALAPIRAHLQIGGTGSRREGS